MSDIPPSYVCVTTRDARLGAAVSSGLYWFRGVAVELDPTRVVRVGNDDFVHVAHLKENNP